MKKRSTIICVVMAIISAAALFFAARAYAYRKAQTFYFEWQQQHILDHEMAELETQKRLEEYRHTIEMMKMLEHMNSEAPTEAPTEEPTPTPEPTPEG